jgi:hypothetical protein
MVICHPVKNKFRFCEIKYMIIKAKFGKLIFTGYSL